MKRLSADAVNEARTDHNEFLPNTIGRQQAELAKSQEADINSTKDRINAAVAEGNAAPLWRAPKLDLGAARAAAHERIRKENAAKQVQ